MIHNTQLQSLALDAVAVKLPGFGGGVRFGGPSSGVRGDNATTEITHSKKSNACTQCSTVRVRSINHAFEEQIDGGLLSACDEHVVVVDRRQILLLRHVKVLPVLTSHERK